MKPPNKTKEECSSRFAAKDIGTKVTARDLLVRDVLNGGPVHGLEVGPLVYPVRNELLTDTTGLVPAQKFREPVSKGGLVTGNFDSALKRSNVISLHDHDLYTNRFVRVNEPVCVTPHKRVCNVLQMASVKRKQAPTAPRSNKRVATPGTDGKTLGQRLAEAMAYESGRRGAQYAQKDLIEDVNRIVRSADETAALFSQPMASAIMLSKVTRSTFTPFIAQACHVDAVWLASGKGQMIKNS